MKYLKLVAVGTILGLILSAACAAQTVSPVFVDCGRKCTGEFTVTNNSITPMFVTVEPFSATLNKLTNASLTAIDRTNVGVELSEMSARIGPRTGHTFSYRITCNAAPCVTVFKASMVTGHTAAGIAVRVIIPSTVYSCEHQRGCRLAVRKAAGLE